MLAGGSIQDGCQVHDRLVQCLRLIACSFSFLTSECEISRLDRKYQAESPQSFQGEPQFGARLTSLELGYPETASPDFRSELRLSQALFKPGRSYQGSYLRWESHSHRPAFRLLAIDNITGMLSIVNR